MVREPLHIFCSRRNYRSPRTFLSGVRTFVRRAGKLRGSPHAVFVGPEISARRAGKIPRHQEVKKSLHEIQGMLKGRPNLRVVFAAEERGHLGDPHVAVYSISQKGYKISLMKFLPEEKYAKTQRVTQRLPSKERVHAWLSWPRRVTKLQSRSTKTDILERIGGHEFVVRACADYSRFGSKPREDKILPGRILLVPAHGLWDPSNMRLVGPHSHLTIVSDPNGDVLRKITRGPMVTQLLEHGEHNERTKFVIGSRVRYTPFDTSPIPLGKGSTENKGLKAALGKEGISLHSIG